MTKFGLFNFDPRGCGDFTVRNDLDCHSVFVFYIYNKDWDACNTKVFFMLGPMS